MVGYGRHSETERVLVNNEGLAILSLLKIQSGLLGNLKESPFDGDEMNLHMAQDVESESELKNLAAVPYQLISPANNKSIIGIYQDSMLGCFRFTRNNVTFQPREAMNLLMMFPRVNEEELLSKGNVISSFDILSQILPPMSMKYKTKMFKDSEDAKTSNHVLEIHNGKYIRGQMDKGVLDAYTKGLIQRVCNDFGNMASSNFIDDLQNIVTEYMKSSAYSVGISDLISDNKTNEQIIQRITDKKNQVKTLIDQTQIGVFENETGRTNEQEFETQVNNILNQASSEAGKIGLENLSKDNRFVIMVNAGSKGSELNISQMISCLGQQNVDGKRIPYGFENRTLPHFSKFDDSPGARGFVESSYIGGLNPQELFFHAMGGRVGLIDTAVKSVTWETPIVIIENNEAKYTEIGRWIDAQLDNKENKDMIQHFTARQMELLDIKEGDVFIPTTDENGVVTWGPVTSITRHDPGTELYEIKTSGGRSVIVTESKSLLIWNAETKKLKEMPTPEIKVGDCVPVTRELCEPPIIKKYIDVSNYLPKNEYVYGSDLNRSIEMMKEAMQNRKKISDGWWQEHNNKDFTLPFTKKSSLQRTSVRSNMSAIKNGFVYPYSGQRKEFCIPEQFALNEMNGIFIGLFLAEGNADKRSVTITNNNETIQTFVKNWFDLHSIQWTEKKRINKLGGLTTTVKGNSSVLSSLLTKMVGHGAENKYVPTEAFIADETFVIGLLNGYFSGDGTVSKNSVEVGSASKRLVEGISMLCSRLAIFGKVFKTQLKSNNVGTKNIKPSYRFAIRAQWGQQFAEKVPLLEEKKQERLRKIVWGCSHRNFDTYNDVVLDKIVEINIIGVEKHPKVYDLTIPTTLNFGLANGLQVRDTSTTGYIQRRLIKGLEDLMVHYDMTIRTNKNKVVQFAYGDDGIDTTKVENQIMPLVSMSVQDIYSHFNLPEETEKGNKPLDLSFVFEKNTLKRAKKQAEDTKKSCKMYTDMMIDARGEIIKNVFKNKGDNVVNCPVAFQYIIGNIQGQQNINGNSLVDITMLETFEMIESTYANLEKIVYCPPTALFKTLYYYYLSPKDLLVVKRFNRAALTILLNTVALNYKRAIVAPGEMVGLTSGQSMGEVSTQMTLNTFHFAGVSAKSNVTRGVPRIEEILSLSSEPKNPSLTVYLRAEEETDKDKAQSIMYMIEHTKLQEVVQSVEICFDPDDMNSLIEEDRQTMQQFKDFESMVDECANSGAGGSNNEKSKWLIRMIMNPSVMLEKNITMDDVNFTLKNSYGEEISCVFSDYNADKLVFRIRMNSVIKQANSTDAKKGKVSPLDQSDQIYILKNFQDQLLENIVLRGIKGINKVSLRKIKDNVVESAGVYKKQDIWVLDTVGTNMLDVLGLDYIDNKRVFSNDIVEVYNVLGIEAARQTIYNEIADVIEFDGTYINYHHFSILCDRMTFTSKMISIFRHGINNDNIGPIAKASFEETPEMFLKAARHAELDTMRGISANIMCGQEGFYGTSAFQVVLDLNEMKKLQEVKEYEYKDEQEWVDEMLVDGENGKGQDQEGDATCSNRSLLIQNNVSHIKPRNLGKMMTKGDDYNPGF